MLKSGPIQISIPNPCHQDWHKMTPDGRGRFCDHCQKSVIDFTSWNDEDLYNFFSKDRGAVCGRFVVTQMDRQINIPYQPYSRLYRFAVALGLTLMVAQAPHLAAQSRAPIITRSNFDTSRISSLQNEGASLGEIRGTVIDEKKEPLIVAVVELFKDNVLKDSVVTDIDGNYRIKDLAPGHYDLVITYTGYITSKWLNVVVTPSLITWVNVRLETNESGTTMGIIVSPPKYKKPLLDRDNPTKMTFDKEDLRRMR